MTPSALYALRWLVRDTFRQALATRLFWLLLGASALAIAFCASARVEGGKSLRPAGEVELYGGDGKPLTGPDPRPGRLSLGFGAVRLALFRDGRAEVHFILVLLAKWVAGVAGMLLALVWTAGFVPDFLQPHTAPLLLAKPVPRWVLLAGKYLGVLAFVAFQAVVFFGGTWLALGWATGVWLPGYLWGIPLLVLGFAPVYAFSVLLGVATRSTAACVLGSILFWVVCFGMNYGRHFVLARPQVAPETVPYPKSFTNLVEAGYWVLPKPADLNMLLDQALEAGEHFKPSPELEAVRKADGFDPDLVLLTTVLFPIAVLLVAGRQLSQVEY